jgi:hypothetical protein
MVTISLEPLKSKFPKSMGCIWHPSVAATTVPQPLPQLFWPLQGMAQGKM